MTTYINEAAPEAMGLLMTPEEAAHEDNPLGLPHGFFRVISAIGKRQLGFGFYCQKCRLHVPLLGRRHEVNHCGHVEVMPRGFFASGKISTYKLPLTPQAIATALRS